MAATNSPDSLPSLADVSQSSNETDDATARILFEFPDDEEAALGARSPVWPKRHDVQDRGGGSSPYSSPRMSSFELESMDEENGIVMRPMTSPFAKLNFEMVQCDGDTENVERSSICADGMALTSQQLVDMFTWFDTSETKANNESRLSPTHSRPASPASTEVTSNLGRPCLPRNPELQTLEQECSTLKEILRCDSVNILQLKTHIATLCSESAKQLGEIAMLKDALDDMKRERDLQQERESQHIENIKVLKTEIDSMTRDKLSMNNTFKEIDQLKLQNELLASQVIQYEQDLKDAEDAMKTLEAETTELRLKLAIMQEEEEKLEEPEDQFQLEELQVVGLIEKVRSLDERLTKIELDRNTTPRLQDDPILKPQLHVQQVERDNVAVPSAAASVKSEDVEVTLSGPVRDDHKTPLLENKGNAPKQAPTKSWSNFCDCFEPIVGEED